MNETLTPAPMEAPATATSTSSESATLAVPSLSLRSRALLSAALVGLPALLLYMRTLMPGVGYWDTAEFQAIGPVLGIAHPTGYPAYTLLMWLGSVVLQPFGDAAFRANMVSALLVAGACAMVGATVTHLTRRFVLGLGAGIVFALGTRAWSIALHADPHAFHLFLAALLLLLLVVWGDRQRAGRRADPLLIAAAVVFGVSLANHALTLLLAPGIALYVVLVYPQILRRLRLVGGCALALVVTTVALYAYLPIRASMHPPMNYADPETWDSFKYVVFGEQFTGTFHARPPLVESVRFIARESWEQLGVLVPLAGLGIVYGVVRRGALVVMLLAWFAIAWWFALGYENADIGRYYLVPLMCVAVAGGMGAGAILDVVDRFLARVRTPDPAAPRLGHWAIAALAAVLLIVPAAVTVPVHFNAVDESRDDSASEWLASLGTLLPQNAVVVSWWSFSTPMWYAQYVEGWRPDVTIIDDRTMLDEHLGDATDVVDSYLGTRPVFLIRVRSDYPGYQQRYVMTPLMGVRGEPVYQVIGYNQAIRPRSRANL